MSDRHLFNDPAELLYANLRSSTLLHPALSYDSSSKSVYLSASRDTDPSTPPPPKASQQLRWKKAKLIAGGGAGHEPAHGGYVGQGMLDGAVSGDIFASPSARQIETCARLAIGPDGSTNEPEGEKQELLVIINNYTGDILNFALAIERIKAGERGRVEVDSVIVDDDVAVGRSQGGKVGRRGLAGNILVCKILGAAAETGLPLKELKTLGDSIVKNLASIGLSLDHCHVPGRSNHESLPPQTSSLGMGLHNEPGVRLLHPTPSPTKAIEQMLELIFDESDDRGFVEGGFGKEDKIVVYVNNLGGVSVLEMGGVVSEVVDVLENRYSIRPHRILCGSFMTSLNGPGFSISLLNVTNAEKRYSKSISGAGDRKEVIGVDVLDLIDAECDAWGWRSAVKAWKHYDPLASSSTKNAPTNSVPERTSPGSKGASNVPQLYIEAVQRACQAIISIEPLLTKYDTIVGDGDCGLTWEKGANGILEAIEMDEMDTTSESAFVESLARIVEDQIGGTSGAIIALFLTALSSSLSSQSVQSSRIDWPTALLDALQILSNYTPAAPGDRTLIDALHPFIHTLHDTDKDIKKSVEACRKGALSTIGMKPKLGRSVYIGDGDDSNEKGGKKGYEIVPDPGAWGVLAVVSGMADVEMIEAPGGD